MRYQLIFICVLALMLADCSKSGKAPKPAILLITLDTTRADRMGWERPGAGTPRLEALAAEGLVFQQAYTTAPMTLPAHTSILTGLYPPQHRIHENGRFVDPQLPTLGTEIQALGYRTAAFVSAWPLAARFGLARGFEHYDDAFGEGASERIAGHTTDATLAWMEQESDDKPPFIWVHYFDPHYPYAAPEAYASAFPNDAYQAEISYMDAQLGRLVKAFRQRYTQRPLTIAVVGDHGEGLGEHGEAQHGNLLYQGVLRVPMILFGSDLQSGRVSEPVSIRRVYHTLLNRAGAREALGLLQNSGEDVVMAEAIKPWLQYGWAPQIAAIQGTTKVIRSAGTEVFDLSTDPGEQINLVSEFTVPEAVTLALDAWLLPQQAAEPALSDTDAERLASLGYTSSSALTTKTAGLPDPRKMVHLFPKLDQASDLFVAGRYQQVIPLFRAILEEDPDNPMLCIRLAVAHSLLNQNDQALEWFRRAGNIVPESVDLNHYLGMHYYRTEEWGKAAEKFEWVLQRTPYKIRALESLADIRMRERKSAEALVLYRKVVDAEGQRPDLLVRMGQLYMEQRNSSQAADVFGKALALSPQTFDRHLELGVCYMDMKRFHDAAVVLDQVPDRHPGKGMALFKRAQVSVLIGEPDPLPAINAARETNNPVVLELIRNEPLFRPFLQ